MVASRSDPAASDPAAATIGAAATAFESPATGDVAASTPAACCPHLHEAIELVGRRWTGAIVEVLRQHEPMRFGEIVAAIPGLSDRLCSQRMKELETRGLVTRTVHAGPPVRVEYGLTEMGRALGPALAELGAWARRWIAPGA